MRSDVCLGFDGDLSNGPNTVVAYLQFDEVFFVGDVKIFGGSQVQVSFNQPDEFFSILFENVGRYFWQDINESSQCVLNDGKVSGFEAKHEETHNV